MSGLMYAVNVNYVVSGGVGDEPGSAKSNSSKSDDSRANVAADALSPNPNLLKPSEPKPKLVVEDSISPNPNLPKPSEPKPELIVEASKVEPKVLKTDIKDEDANGLLEGTCSIKLGPSDGGMSSNLCIRIFIFFQYKH